VTGVGVSWRGLDGERSDADDLLLIVSGAVPRGQVLVGGELDLLTAPRLERFLIELLQAGYREVGVDASGVNFFAAAGLNALCRVTGRYRAAGGRLQLVAMPAQIRRVLALSGLDAGLDVTPASSDGQVDGKVDGRVDGIGHGRS
jgi:anti-sigma B factor antagonist